MKIPFFQYPHVFQKYEKDFIAVLREVGNRGAFIMQKDLAEFEQNLVEYTGARYVVGVANATDGLQMLLMAGGLKTGEEVIICSHTMIATASAIHFAGGIPVPVEVSSDHLIDPKAVRDAITSRTKAICTTQLNGRICDMDALMSIADENGLDLYEDAAQALGARFRGRGAGTFGKGGCISFYPAKVLGSLGDGGAVLTNDEEIYRKLLLLRDHGRGADGDIDLWGFNSRLDNLHAAFLNFQLMEYPSVVFRRRHLANLYQKGLENCEFAKLPPAPDSDPDHFDIFQNYEIEVEKRDMLREYLKSMGIGTLIQWGGKAVHQFCKLGFTHRLPKTDQIYKHLLMLPLNMSVTDEEISYIINCILEFYE